jgi:methylated-DNA-[protein]-cysteine S-methyltransferase
MHDTVKMSTPTSPLGPLTLVAAGGELSEVRLPGEPADGGQISPALAGGECGRRKSVATASSADDAVVLAEAAAQLAGYFAGRRRAFDLPLALRGTAFQLAVWRELLRVPCGETVSYAELAARVGRPGAARAVGRAVGQNPLAIVVPCHRAIGSDGRLTGYAGGLEAKSTLLRLEAAHRSVAAGD